MVLDADSPYDVLTGAAATFAWTAARHWDDVPARRRALRLATVAVLVALTVLAPGRGGARPGTSAEPDARPAPGALPAAEGPAEPPGLPLVVSAAAALAVSVGSPLLWGRVEDRWLRRLARRGHPRPAVSLGLRLAAAQAALALAAQAAGEHDERRDAERAERAPADAS